MWENETVVLATSLRKRLLGDAGSVRFGKISSDNGIPVFVKVQFQSRIEKYLQNESPLTLHNTPHFQFKEEELSLLRGRFMDAFRETATFDGKEIEEILREALTMKLDYLVKPSATMRKLLFNGKISASLKKMEDVLNPYTKVLPYAETLIKTCRNHQVNTLENDNYGLMMEDVFETLFGSSAVERVLNDFAALHEFLSETKGETIDKSEGNLLLDFFSDRSLWGFRRAVEVEMKLGRVDFDGKALEMTLKRYEALKQDFPEKAETVVKKTAVEALPKAAAPATELKVSQIPEIKIQEETVVDEVPLPKPSYQEEQDIKSVLNDIMNEKNTEISQPEAAASSEVDAKENKEPEGDGVWDLEDVLDEEDLKPVDKNETEKIEDQAKPKSMGIVRKENEEETVLEPDAKPHKGLRSYINEKTEKGFVKKLFSGDHEAYDELLDKLDEAESWRVAKILIDNELFKRDVDPFSREAIRLVDMVYSRYYPEESIGGV